MTIDASTGDQPHSAHPVPDKSDLPELIRRNSRDALAWVSAHGGEVRNLEPVYIPGIIRPLQTEGAYGGVNKSMTTWHPMGLLIEIPAYQNMQANDWIKVYWGDDHVPVTSGGVLPEQVGKPVPMAVRANLVPEGIHALSYVVERAGGGNPGEGTPVSILVRTELPGGIDPEPDLPNHQGMPPADIDVPESGVIDEEAAKAGVKVTIRAYPNMRQYDRLILHWSGVEQVYEVTPDDIAANRVQMVVTEDTILKAGDGDSLVVVYRVLDEVHNVSDGWSMRAYVTVEVGVGLFTAPFIQNPDPDADPADLIDLDKLGDEDLTVSVLAMSDGELQRDDVITLTWVGTTSQDQEIIVIPDPRTVAGPAILNFVIPNADLLGLAHGRGHASYEVTRDGSSAGVSKRAFVSFLGVEKGLPKPTVSDNVDGTLDPALAYTTVTVPGDALELNDHVTMVWLGTRSDGSVLLHSVGRPVSGAGVGKPMNFTIDGPEHIAVLDGGSVSVYYRLYKYKLERELTSESELLIVGEAQSALPAPVTKPSADSGFIQPEDLPGGQLEIIVAPYSGMKVGQTVRLVWKASLGPAYDDWMEVTPPLEGKEVPFYMDRGTFEQYRDATVELAYQIEEPGVPTRLSSPVTFTVGVKEAALPPPVLPQAVGGVLNPADASEGAIVQVPVEAALAFGDEVEVSWTGDKPGGVTKKSEPVYAEDVGKPFDVIIDYQYVVANNEGNVVVSYQVYQGGAGGGAPISDPQTVRVQGAALPRPVIRQAENGELNPDDVLQGATAVIDASAQLKDGDQVLLRVMSPASGGSTTIPHVVAPGDGGKPVELTIDYRFINASNGVSIDLEYDITRFAGGPVETSEVTTYLINREVGSGPLKVMGARYNLNTYRASSASRMIHARHAQTLDPLLAEWQYEGDTQWTARTQWFDKEPWKRLYVRNKTQTYVLNPCPSAGNGVDTAVTGAAAFAVIRDEVIVGSEKEVDLRAWGNEANGGKMPPTLITFKNVSAVNGTANAYAALLRDGNVVCWPPAVMANPGENGNFVRLCSNAGAFVGLRADGSLFSWGAATHGVPVTDAVKQHTDYKDLCGAGMAFAGLRSNGQIVAWGNEANGGKMKDGQEVMSGFKQIVGNYAAFAALHDVGGSKTVIAWGHPSYGGDVTDDIAGIVNAKALGAATAQAFTVLLDSGEVRAWGPKTYGGEIPELIKPLRNISEIVSTWQSFCALLTNGHVVAWGGTKDTGGEVPPEIAGLSDIIQVVGSAFTFAALRRGGQVVVWGDVRTGGDMSAVAGRLVNVLAIYANSHGFFAQTASGDVVAWGVPAGGGDCSAIQGDLTGKVTHGHFLDEGGADADSSSQART